MTIQDLDKIRLELEIAEMVAKDTGADQGELICTTKTGEEIRRPPVRSRPFEGQLIKATLVPPRGWRPGKDRRKPDLETQEARMGRYERDAPAHTCPLYGDAVWHEQAILRARKEHRAQLEGRRRCH